MAFTLRSVKVPPNSASLEEARSRVFDFFRQACRSIPTIMDIYNLDDVVTKSELRSSISSEIRKNSHVTNPKLVNPESGYNYRAVKRWTSQRKLGYCQLDCDKEHMPYALFSLKDRQGNSETES
ncbi:NADH dehydrogenase [ubiquinone] 1 alpha subcomplex subunit 6 isoform X4 [Gossypium raimondii]|uniref:NADH dehydrogenase [ubiquinone] 1 alpha subcomplex subunit 6 isoform X4 n=1 Tax=Gossypium raimondii TaxID=29730 RepID=UPI00227BA80D|nr:NADH dehydrogenase [ubiquinone] 1 alpha subcomplex subunit 6 isoform X4 [Gossypium raimondii]